MTKIKKCWVLEKYCELEKKGQLLAVFNSNTSYEKIKIALEALVMADCENFKALMKYKNYKAKWYHTHNDSPDVIIACSNCYWKAPFRAWKTELNLETGEYLNIDRAHLKGICS